MPATLQAKPTPQRKQILNRELIAYFSTCIGLQHQRYMSFEAGLSLLCTLISARSRFLPKSRGEVNSPEYEYLQKNVEEVGMGLVLESPREHTMHLSHSIDIINAIESAQERFFCLVIEAPELGEMKKRLMRDVG